MNAPKVSALRKSLPFALAALSLVGTIADAQATRTNTPTTMPQEKAKAGIAAEAGPVDVNSASADELMTLPGVGEAIARKIIDNRPYKAVDDLSGAGVPAPTVAKIKPLAVARPLPAPVDVNNATAEPLQTLPGVGPALSRANIDARPFRNYDALAKVKGLGEAKLAGLRGRVEFGKARAVEAAEKGKAEAKGVAEKSRTKGGEVVGKGKAKAGEGAEKVNSKVGTAKEASKSKLPAGKTVNINTASKEELDQLFGIGEARAQAIIDGRPYKTIDDVKNVKGIGEGVFARIKDRITVK
jgi:competence ComEA-like helix-hairpin-helix protein